MSSNRTIVGLKPAWGAALCYEHLPQQSHHCGIETRSFLRLLQFRLGQQSHHCGIETFNDGVATDRFGNAAIAPLWD